MPTRLTLVAASPMECQSTRLETANDGLILLTAPRSAGVIASYPPHELRPAVI